MRYLKEIKLLLIRFNQNRMKFRNGFKKNKKIYKKQNRYLNKIGIFK